MLFKGLLKIFAVVIAAVLALSACSSVPGSSGSSSTSSTASSPSSSGSSASSSSSVDNYVITPRDIPFTNTWVNSICYSGYRNGEDPTKNIFSTYSEITNDLQILSKKWSIIRVYGSDPETEMYLQAISNEGYPLKVFLCAWIGTSTSGNMTQLTDEIRLANDYSNIVEAVIVGSESQVSWGGHGVSADTLISYIRLVRTNITQPVTTADDYSWWQGTDSHGNDAPKVAKELDFILMHTHPMRHKKTIADAMADTIAKYTAVKSIYTNQYVLVGETGWASTGFDGTAWGNKTNNGESETNEWDYYTNVNNWGQSNNILIFFFDAFDEAWKADGSPKGAGLESHWGLFTTNRLPKLAMTNDYPELVP
jgi:exo-beta-1,3-glucanase (GH17 family)